MRLVYQIPFEPLFKSRKLVKQRGLDRFYREQRHQADERAHAHPKISSAGHVQYVVVKLVLLVPEPDSFTAKIIHRRGDA